MRTPLSNGAQHDTFNQYPRVSTHSQQRTYSFYADCIPCPAYSANPFSFPLGLVMDTTNVRQQYVGQAPLISIVNLGAGLNGALGSVRQQLQHVWRNIIRVEIADQHVSHLRIIGCGLSINTTALSDEQRRRGFLAVELTITLMAERDAPSSSLIPLGAQKRAPDKGIAHCYESS